MVVRERVRGVVSMICGVDLELGNCMRISFIWKHLIMGKMVTWDRG